MMIFYSSNSKLIQILICTSPSLLPAINAFTQAASFPSAGPHLLLFRVCSFPLCRKSQLSFCPALLLRTVRSCLKRRAPSQPHGSRRSPHQSTLRCLTNGHMTQLIQSESCARMFHIGSKWRAAGMLVADHDSAMKKTKVYNGR